MSQKLDRLVKKCQEQDDRMNQLREELAQPGNLPFPSWAFCSFRFTQLPYLCMNTNRSCLEGWNCPENVSASTLPHSDRKCKKVLHFLRLPWQIVNQLL